MAKPRPPLSIYDALWRTIGELSLEVACQVTKRVESHLRKCTDPQSGRHLTVADAVALDQAQLADGRAPHLLTYYTTAVEADGPQSALDHIRNAVRELEAAEKVMPKPPGVEGRAILRALCEVTAVWQRVIAANSERDE